MSSGKSGKKSGRKLGHRQPVEFVLNPDTGQPVQGLRLHRASRLYYRYDHKKSSQARAKAVYYPRNNLKGVAYLRYAILHRTAWLNGQTIPDSETIVITKPVARDMFGTGADDYSSFVINRDGTATSEIELHKEDILRWVRDKILNPDRIERDMFYDVDVRPAR